MGKATKQRLATTDLVLLDEALMVSCRLFTTLVHCLWSSRQDLRRAFPWRVLAFGDLYQLPAVHDADDDDIVFDAEAGNALWAAAWAQTFGNKVLELTYVCRQADVKFIDLLNELRVVVVSPALTTFLDGCHRAYQDAVASSAGLGRAVTHLFPQTADVVKHNMQCLTELVDASACALNVYEAADKAFKSNLSELVLEKVLNKALMAPKRLEGCVGARVAMCGNSLKRTGVYNGTIGVATEFEANSDPVVPSESSCLAVPLVQLSTVGRGLVTTVVQPEKICLESVLRDGSYAERFQVPLALAWGVTINRVQGLSLDRAVLDLALCFACGMVFVALSRVRSMDGILVKSYDVAKIRTDAVVRSFYERQESLRDDFASCVPLPSAER